MTYGNLLKFCRKGWILWQFWSGTFPRLPALQPPFAVGRDAVDRAWEDDWALGWRGSPDAFSAVGVATECIAAGQIAT